MGSPPSAFPAGHYPPLILSPKDAVGIYMRTCLNPGGVPDKLCIFPADES